MTTAPPTPHWLLALCDPHEGRSHDLRKRPYVVAWRGTDYTVATDGRLLCALQGHHAGAEPAPPTVAERLLSVLEGGATASGLDWVRFRAWIGPPPPQTHECPICEAGLHFVGGKLVEAPDPCPVRFRGHLLDKHRLSRAVAHLEGGEGVTADWADSRLTIDGPGWRVILMAMNHDAGRGEAVATWEEEVPEP